MRAIAPLFLFLAIGISAAADPGTSRFAGRWSGPWKAVTFHQSGRFVLDISGAGKIVGAVTNADKVGTIDGEIDAEGHVDARYSYGRGFTYSATGTMVRRGDHLRGTVHYATPAGDDLGSSDLDLRLGATPMPSQPISAPPSLQGFSSRS